jgi:hypothetical protein
MIDRTFASGEQALHLCCCYNDSTIIYDGKDGKILLPPLVDTIS